MAILSRTEVLRLIHANLNEYKNQDWFKERKCEFVKVFDETIRIDFDITQGYCAIDGRRLYLILRGSDETKDWFGADGNFNFWLTKDETPITQKINTSVMVEAGFLRGWKKVKQNVFALIDKYKPLEIMVTGHSRGAAMGAIAAQNIAWHYPEEKVYGLYLSSPRPGNQEFCDDHDMRVIKSLMLYITGDPVTATPLLSMGYRHIKNTLGLFGGIKWPPFFAGHYPDNLLKTVQEKYFIGD